MKPSERVTGNILLFYAFDVGDDIDLDLIHKKDLVPTYTVPQSPYFKDYHVPLAFRLLEPENGSVIEREDAVLNKIHHFGVISLCYKVSFDDTFENLKKKFIEIQESYESIGEADARAVFKNIFSAIRKPHFYNLKNDYFAVHVNPIEGKLTADEFKEKYGGKIASLLRFETQVLSEYQQDDILESATGYYGEDFIVIDSEASFVYDDEYFEPMEFFELANVQQLELQYYDRVLDGKLAFFYQQEQYKIPAKSYIPLIGRRFELPITKLVRLRVDISVVTDRLDHSIKRTGDAYYSKLYSMLVHKLSLGEWRDSISRKLDIIQDLHSVHQAQLDTVHEEMLTMVIIILIAVEVIAVFLGH